MHITYILRSEKTKKYYIGHTHDMESRLKCHNSGFVRSTKSGRPWTIVYKEFFKTKSEAYKREMEIKNYKGGIQFKEMLRLK